MQVFKLSWAVAPDEDGFINPAELEDGACVTVTHAGTPIKYGSTVWDIMVEHLPQRSDRFHNSCSHDGKQ